MGPGNVQEATPLVYNGVMYVPNPNDYISALEAGTGRLLWEYRREIPSDLGKYLPFYSINRNLAIYGTTIIDTSADDFVFALDAQTGKLAWETKVLDYRKGAQQRSGPIIARGKVISGRGCEPEGGPDDLAFGDDRPLTTRAPARSSGGGARFRRRANRATRHGAECPSRGAITSAHGWCRATILR